jgi:predicted acyl esterase
MHLTLVCEADAPDFDLWAQVLMVLPDGARLRLTIAPLNSPNYQKNYNTGGRVGYEKLQDARIALIRIFHDAKRASRLSVPLAAASKDAPSH